MLPYFVDNFSYRTNAESPSNTLYLPTEALDALPDLNADGASGVILTLDDEAGNTEQVQAYQKTGTYAIVDRDVFNLGYQPTSWPADTLVECRPVVNVMQLAMNQYLAERSLGAGVNTFMRQMSHDCRVIVVTLDENSNLLFDTATITAAISQRTVVQTVVLIQDATGGHTVTWPAGIFWEGGAAPTLDTTPGTLSVFEFMWLSTGQIIGRRVVSGASS